MATDVRAPQDTKPSAPRRADEDEDLFDFPIVEMTLEVEASAPPLTIGELVGAALPAPAPASASSTAALLAASDVTLPAAAPAVASAPASADEAAPTTEPRPAARKRRSRRVATNGSPATLLAGLLLLNLLTFGFFWYLTRSLGNGVTALRDELLLAAKTTPTVQAAPVAPAPPPSHAPAQPTERAEPQPPLRAPALVFERTTLELAAQEIQAGEMLSARKRLHRLLAMVDRVEPELRADVEARARYLIADSYSEQAARRGRDLAERSREGGGH
jgi:hypothetical protein